MNALDCPDGLARCENGVVSVSRLATIPMSCKGPPGACACPWRRAGVCAYGCAAEGIEVVIDEVASTVQLCAPAADDGGIGWRPLDPPLAARVCEEGQRYQCGDGLVTDCLPGVGIGRCARGCFREGASIDDDGASREAAFAVLCSR